MFGVNPFIVFCATWDNCCDPDELFGSPHNLIKWALDLSNGYKIQQFTGLKDKTGRDIYEGDILLIPDSEVVPVLDYGQCPTEDCNHLIEVIFECGCFGVKPAEFKHLWRWRKSIVSLVELFEEYPIETGVEIIGNIFESPELIPAAK